MASDGSQSPISKVRRGRSGPPPLVDLTLSDSDDEERTTSNNAVIVNFHFNSELSEWSTNSATQSTSRAAAAVTSQKYIANAIVRDNTSDPLLKVEDDDEEILTESDSDDKDNPAIVMGGTAVETNDIQNVTDENPDAQEDNFGQPIIRPPTPPPTLQRDADEPMPSTSNKTMPMLVDPLLGEVPSPAVFEPSPSPPTKKKPWSTKCFSEEQLQILTSAHDACAKLMPLTTLDLMSQTGLSKSQVQYWFSQRNRKRRISQADAPSSPLPNQGLQRSTVLESNLTGGSLSMQNSNSPIPQTQEGDATVQKPVLKAKRQPQTSDQIIKKIEDRRDKILTFPPSKIQEVLERCYSRSSILLRLFIEEKRGMKRKLVNETFRIKEKSPSQSVFNDEQISCITEWRTNFVERKTIGKSTQIIESLNSANLNILKVWIPLMVYGYLLNISLDETVKDFTFYSRNRAFDTEDYIFPRYLSYYQRASCQ